MFSESFGLQLVSEAQFTSLMVADKFDFLGQVFNKAEEPSDHQQLSVRQNDLF